MRLPVHLPNEQAIIFDDNNINEQQAQDLLESIASKSSMLMEYFALNARDPAAREYLYSDIPQFYTFTKLKIWEKRKARFNTLGRMYVHKLNYFI